MNVALIKDMLTQIFYLLFQY